MTVLLVACDVLSRGMRNTLLQHDGLTLGCSVAGSPEQPAIVLLHGWPQSKEVYDLVIDELAAEHFVVAFDLPAIGDSRGAPRSAGKHELAELMIGAAERLGARSMIVAGFDVGGMIAYAAARDQGHRIAGAAVMNTVLPGLDPWAKLLADPRIWHFAFHSLPELPELLVAGHQRAYFDYFINALAGRKEALSDHYRERFARAYQPREALKAGFDWYRAMPADAAHNAAHQDVLTPILYLRGDADGRSPDEYVDGIEAAGAKDVSSVVLRGSGEFAPLEVPQQFNRALLSFARTCHAR